MNEKLYVEAGSCISIKERKPERLITISMTREEYNSTYCRRTRIGIFLLRIIGIIKLEIKED